VTEAWSIGPANAEKSWITSNPNVTKTQDITKTGYKFVIGWICKAEVQWRRAEVSIASKRLIPDKDSSSSHNSTPDTTYTNNAHLLYHQ
jgi:hypothetical protein